MTIISPNSLDTTVMQDGQAANTITPLSMRIVIDSLAGIVPSTKTASYTAVLADRGTMIEFNSSSATNFTIPPNSSAAFDIGTVLSAYQMGTGQFTLVPGAGVTLRTPSTLTSRAQFSTVMLRKRATDEWVCSGDLT